ncbi:toluene tolerance protein [Acetobacter sicerae]|nr:toluene tolerance protein [Acetobacter sicerae]
MRPGNDALVKTVLASPRFLARLWREDRRTLLHELMLLFIGSGFILPNEPVWSDVFYIGIIPLFIYAICKKDFDVRLKSCPAPLLAAGGIMLSFCISAMVNVTAPSQIGASAFWMWNILCTSIFVFLLTDAFTQQTNYRERLIRLMIGAGMINILIALILRLGFQPLPWEGDILRMQGWGLTRHPILGAVIMGTILLMALSKALSLHQWRYWAATLAALVFILLTGSRGPLMGILLAVPVLAGMKYPKTILTALPVLAVITVIGLRMDVGVFHLVQEQIGRGDSHRFMLWSLAWRDICQMPVFGHGPASKFNTPGEPFPHNLLLSTWLYAGAVGVVALMVYLGTVCKSLFSSFAKSARPLSIAILLHTLVSSMTDFAQVVKGPAPMWYMFWLATIFAAQISPRPKIR